MPISPPGSCRPPRRGKPASCGKAWTVKVKNIASTNTGRCRNPRTACGTGSCSCCGDGPADARGSRTRQACRHAAATRRLYSPAPPACRGPGRAGARAGRGRPSDARDHAPPLRAGGTRERVHEAHKLRGAQASRRRPGRGRGRRLTPDGGFPGRTYRTGTSYRAGGRGRLQEAPRRADPIGKSGHRPARSTLRARYVYCPQRSARRAMHSRRGRPTGGAAAGIPPGRGRACRASLRALSTAGAARTGPGAAPGARCGAHAPCPGPFLLRACGRRACSCRR